MCPHISLLVNYDFRLFLGPQVFHGTTSGGKLPATSVDDVQCGHQTAAPNKFFEKRPFETIVKLFGYADMENKRLHLKND